MARDFHRDGPVPARRQGMQAPRRYCFPPLRACLEERVQPAWRQPSGIRMALGANSGLNGPPHLSLEGLQHGAVRPGIQRPEPTVALRRCVKLVVCV